MTNPSHSAPRADTREGADSEGRLALTAGAATSGAPTSGAPTSGAPTPGLLADTLAPGRRYNERQRELVQASLIAR